MTDEGRIETIRKLLAKAEATTNEHERDAFNGKATALMLQWSIDEARLSRTTSREEKMVKWVCEDTGPITYSLEYANLCAWIAHAVGGEGVIQKRGNRSRAVIFGFESDIALIKVLYASLMIQCTMATATAYKANVRTWWSGPDRFNFKRSFIIGFSHAVHDKMRRFRGETITAVGGDAELVLVDRQAQVDRWMREQMKVKDARPRRYLKDAHALGGNAGDRADVGTTSLHTGHRELEA